MFKFRTPIYRPTTAAPIDSNLSPAERYAKTIRETAVDEILKTIKSSKRLGMLLVLLVIVISFQHQRDFFLARHAGEVGSIGLPVIFDVSIIFFVRQVSTTGMNKLVLWLSAGGLLIPVGASATINFAASPDPLVGWAYVAAIGLVAVIEVVKALAGPDPAALREKEHSADAPAASAVDEQVLDEEELARQQAEAAKEAKRAQDRQDRRVLNLVRREMAKLEAAAAMPVSPATAGVGPVVGLYVPTDDEVAALVR